jgi:hypothetical protein
VRFDTILNLLWLLLGLSAVLATIRIKPRRKGLRVLGAALVVAALFPFISATDDLLRIEQAAQPDGPNGQLVRLYLNMETPLEARAPQLTYSVSFTQLITKPVQRRIERSEPLRLGRSPPAGSINS